MTNVAGVRAGGTFGCGDVDLTVGQVQMMVYYEWIAKTPTRRQIRDAELVEIITAAREDKKKGRFVQTLGSRKLWIWLRGQGHDVARCTVERIMREQGWEGARYGSKHKTTIADDSHVRYPDLVDRRFYDRRHPPGHLRVSTGRNRATSTGREGDNLAIHRAVDDGQPGDVLAINAKARPAAPYSGTSSATSASPKASPASSSTAPPATSTNSPR